MKIFAYILACFLPLAAAAQPLLKTPITTNTLGSGTGMLTNNGAGVIGWMTIPSSGGPLTPWTSDIEGGGFSLNNAFSLLTTGSTVRFMTGGFTNMEVTSTSVKLFSGGSSGRYFQIGQPNGAGRAFTYSNGQMRVQNAASISTFLHDSGIGAGTTTLPGILNIGTLSVTGALSATTPLANIAPSSVVDWRTNFFQVLTTNGHVVVFIESNACFTIFPLASTGTNSWQVLNTNGQPIAWIDTNNVFNASNAAFQTLTVTGPGVTGVATIKLYDDAQTEYSALEAPFDIQTNNVIRTPSNAVEGVLVLKKVGTGTNQMVTIPLGVGMFTNDGAGVYGWMAIPSSGGAQTPWASEIEGAGFELVHAGSLGSSNISLISSPGRTRTMLQASSTNNSLTVQIGANGLLETFTIPGTTNDSFRADRTNGQPALTVNSNGTAVAWNDLQVSNKIYMIGYDDGTARMVLSSWSLGVVLGGYPNTDIGSSFLNASGDKLAQWNGLAFKPVGGVVADLGASLTTWSTTWTTGLVVRLGAGDPPAQYKVLTANSSSGDAAWKSSLTLDDLTISSNQTLKYLVLDNVATNGSANSNLTMNTMQGNRDIFLTNNISITNFQNIPTPLSTRPVTWILHPQLVNRALVLPTLGGPQFGVRLFTNNNNTIPTTLLPNTNYVLSITWYETNGYITVTEWK